MSAPSDNAQLEIMVTGALGGHDLTGFESVDQPGGGSQAHCRRCKKTVWVGDDGLIYSLLDEVCSASNP